MGQVFRTVMKKYNLAFGDFPDIADMSSKLQEMDFTKFSKLKQKLIDDVEQVLGNDFPRLMEALPRVEYNNSTTPGNSALPSRGGPNAPPLPPSSSRAGDDSNPWWDGEDDDNAFGGSQWALQDAIPMYEGMFNSAQTNGKVNGKEAAKTFFGNTGLPKATLKQIWDLGDIDKDGHLDLYEFVIVMYLIEQAKQGLTIPAVLDPAMIPPGK